ncbi:MAG: thiamine-phosphate kinase [Thermoplasmata archaeon]|nr:thiamine-phosphate kinase [Thermoplasmata archaeon]MCI4361825.1 thiamine-phosphate kinase [Thermoplasmata archaeon]
MTRKAGPSAFSERRFHAWLSRDARRSSQIPLPLGDDAAAVRLRSGRLGLLTTDALVEGTHFLAASPPAAVGRAAAAVSLSDIAAKGGRPVALLLDLLLPPRTPVGWARSVTAGARAEVRRWGGELVGGDTKPSGTRAVVGTILAEADPGRLAPRGAGRPGDRLILTGSAGRGGAAARALEQDGPTPAVLRGLLHVEPRLFEGATLVRYAHAMLDTSDGLGEAARLLAQASGVRAELDLEKVPGHPSLRAVPAGPERERALFFGGDYELLAAVPPGRVGPALAAVTAVGGRAQEIGGLRRGSGAWLRRRGIPTPLPTGGWDPFGWALTHVEPSQSPG